MEAIILKCPHYARYHFGLVSADPTTALSQTSASIESDTLFSALIVLCAKTFPDEVEKLIDYFKSAGVLISSSSYCLDVIADGTLSNRIFFLRSPCYLGLLNRTENRKKVGRAKYISKYVWENGLLPHEWNEYQCYSLGKHFLISSEELSRDIGGQVNTVFSIGSEPKIADHARQRQDNIYFQTDLFLNTTNFNYKQLADIGFEGMNSLILQPHFYFLLDFKVENERLRNLIYLLLDLLPDEGLGGSISTGCGKIEAVEKQDWTLDLAEQVSKEQAVSASLISVDNEGELRKLVAKKMIIRGGRRTANHGTLARIRMTEPGALVQKGITGNITNLHRTHKYLRYGMAFPLPISSKYELND